MALEAMGSRATPSARAVIETLEADGLDQPFPAYASIEDRVGRASPRWAGNPDCPIKA